MSIGATCATPSASDRVTGKSEVMPILCAMSAIGWRPVLIERFTATVLTDSANAVCSDIEPP